MNDERVMSALVPRLVLSVRVSSRARIVTASRGWIEVVVVIIISANQGRAQHSKTPKVTERSKEKKVKKPKKGRQKGRHRE